MLLASVVAVEAVGAVELRRGTKANPEKNIYVQWQVNEG